jgi:hypothetical protein
MVLQVPNKPDPNDIGRWLDTIYQEWAELPNGCVANVLGEHRTEQFGKYNVPYISPEQVQDATWVRVLIAKDAISTGWDCPRAEVMVSFRPAEDHTYITQLLGRMVRSPLARRIPGNERLNAVDCLLPNFNKSAVQSVVNALVNGDDTLPAAPGRILVNPVEMKPNPSATPAVWQVFEALPSQSRPQRGAKPAKRLTALAHELASDGILPHAGKLAHAEMHKALDKFQESEKLKIEAKRKAVLTVEGTTVIAEMKGNWSFDDFWESADMAVIEDAYRRSARIFSPDISRTYADHLAYKVSTPDKPDEFEEAIVDARVSIAALGLVTEAQAYFDTEADKLANAWLTKYSNEIKKLTDDQKEAYRQIVEMSTQPQDVDLVKPETKFEPTKVRENNHETELPSYKNHLLCDENGNYPAQWKSEWEPAVLEAESKRKGFSFWYRNPQQPGQSSLGIAYLDGDEYKIVRPDFIFFASLDDGNVVADIVDPHGIHFADALPKLKGLALYAETHAKAYRRFESVAEVKGRLRVLDLTRKDVRNTIESAKDAANLFLSPLASDYE